MMTQTILVCWPDGRQELLEEDVPEIAPEDTSTEQ